MKHSYNLPINLPSVTSYATFSAALRSAASLGGQIFLWTRFRDFLKSVTNSVHYCLGFYSLKLILDFV